MAVEEKDKPIIYLSGVCPYCESENVDYDKYNYEDNFIEYPMTCLDCGKHSIELYFTEFERTEGVD